MPWTITDPGRQIYDGNKLTVLGWGKITNNKFQHLRNLLRNRAGSGTLKQLVVPAISKRKCKEYDALKNYELNQRLQLCAGGETG